MPNSLDATGLTVAIQSELSANFTTAMQTIYGSDINLASDTPDGEQMGLFLQAVLDLQDLLVQIYNSYNPDNAIGVQLDQRVAINGIQRQAGTYTVTNITVVNSQSVNLYGLDQQGVQPVYTVEDNFGNQWQLITTQLGLSTGTNVLAFQAATPGANLTVPNTITVQVTVVLGVTSVNNPTTYSTLGLSEETDAALKVRRQQSVAISSQGYYQGLYAALKNINGITSVFVWENTSDSTSNGTIPAGIPAGIPSHTLWAIVAGVPAPPLGVPWNSTISYSYGQIVSYSGSNYISYGNVNTGNTPTSGLPWALYNPVAQSIYAKRSAGCGMKGSTSYLITQINGTSFFILYDTVTPETLFIKFTATSLNGATPPNITTIVAGLPSIYVPGVGQDGEVDINGLATAVQSLDPNTLVTGAGFSTSVSGSYTNTLLPASPTQQFAVSAADIVVLTMILNGGAGTSGIGYVFSAGAVLNTTLTIANGGNTFQFAAVGGYGAITYSMVSGSGSVDPSSGIYISGSAGTDVVEATDSLSHTCTCTVTVT